MNRTHKKNTHLKINGFNKLKAGRTGSLGKRGYVILLVLNLYLQRRDKQKISNNSMKKKKLERAKKYIIEALFPSFFFF